MPSQRCTHCGRFMRYDATMARWQCDGCDRTWTPPRSVYTGPDPALQAAIRRLNEDSDA